MDWTHIITLAAGLIPFFINLFVNNRKRLAELAKEEAGGTELLMKANDACYRELTELRKLFVDQERKLMELELLTIRLEATQKDDITPSTH